MEAARLYARGDLQVPDPYGKEDEPEASFETAAAGFKLVIEKSPVVQEDEFYLWPENYEVWMLWRTIQSQWVIEEGKRRRLNYSGVQVCLGYWPGIRKKERADAFHLIQSMEQAALEEWSD
jgi:hypothetical protein